MNPQLIADAKKIIEAKEWFVKKLKYGGWACSEVNAFSSQEAIPVLENHNTKAVVQGLVEEVERLLKANKSLDELCDHYMSEYNALNKSVTEKIQSLSEENTKLNVDLTAMRQRLIVSTKLLKGENLLLTEALSRVMNSDLVTTTQFNDYSEAFSNAREVLKKLEKKDDT